MLRANRMTPAGGQAANSAASSASRAGPAMPTMAALVGAALVGAALVEAALIGAAVTARSEFRHRAGAALGPHLLAEAARLDGIGETRGPHPPEGVSVALDAGIAGLVAGQQVRHALDQCLPLIWAACSLVSAASCTVALWAVTAGAAGAGVTAAGAATGLGGG